MLGFRAFVFQNLYWLSLSKLLITYRYPFESKYYLRVLRWKSMYDSEDEVWDIVARRVLYVGDDDWFLNRFCLFAWLNFRNNTQFDRLFTISRVHVLSTSFMEWRYLVWIIQRYIVFKPKTYFRESRPISILFAPPMCLTPLKRF